MRKLIDAGRELLIPALSFFVAVVIALITASVAAQLERQRIDKSVVEENSRFAEHFFTQLQLLIDPAEKSTETMAHYAESRNTDFTSPEDQWFLDKLAQDTTGWRNLSVAPHNCISAVAPLQGNESAVGYCLTSNPDEAENIIQIMEYKNASFFGPIDLAQDTQGFIYDFPVFLSDGQYWGMTTAVINSQDFIDPLMDLAKRSGMAFSLSMIPAASSGTPLPVTSQIHAEKDFRQSFEFVDDGATFYLTIAPRFVDYKTADGYFVRIFIVGVILALMISLGVYLLLRQSRTAHKLEMLTKGSPSVLFRLRMDKTGNLTLDYVTEGSTNALGYSPEDISLHFPEFVSRLDQRDREAAVIRLRSVKSPGEKWSQRMRYDHPTLGLRWLQVEATYERSLASGGSWNGIFLDVTATAEQEHQLSISAGVFSALNEGVAILDSNWKVIDINPGITRTTGFTQGDLYGRDFTEFGSGLNTDALYSSLKEAVVEHGYWRGEIVNRHKSGRISKDMLTVSSVVDDSGTLTQIIIVMNSIEKMIIDSVTGLPNRTHFEEHLAETIERVQDENASLALMEINITGVGAVNDSFGYKIGDLLLHEIGQRISEFAVESRSIGRVGDTTFGMVRVFEGNPAQLEELSTQILEALAAPFTFDDVSVLISAAIGIALLSEQSHTVEELRSHAGQASKVALEVGEQGFQFFTTKMETGAKVRSYLTSDLQDAIKNKVLTFHFQPIVRISDRHIVKAEALARWFDEHIGEVSPARFIPLAEESGLIHELGAQLFDACIDTALELQRRGRPISISLNVSPVEIMAKGFNRDVQVKEAIERGLDPQNIVFELTEGILLNRRELIEERIRACRRQGIQFAIDDFGTGYSSLAYLQQLDVDLLKIDKIFIDKIDTDEGYALCRSIIELAHALGLEVIAEGVESEQQYGLLENLGCDYAQGYLFSRALARNDFLELLGFKQD